MKKIRVNELARELEVKAHELLDRLPELGVTDKKTHSSSLDDDLVLKLRRLFGQDVSEYENRPPSDEDSPEEAAADELKESHEEPSRPAVEEKPAAPAPVAEKAAAPAPTPEPAPAAQAERPAPAAPIRPPLSTGRPIHPPIVAPGTPRPAAPPAPQRPAAPPAPAHAAPQPASTPHLHAPAAVIAPGRAPSMPGPRSAPI